MFFSLLKSDVNPTLRNASEGIRTACDSQLPGARFPRDGELASFARQFPLEFRSIYRYGLGHVVWHPPPSAQDIPFPVTRQSKQVVTRLGIPLQSELSK